MVRYPAILILTLMTCLCRAEQDNNNTTRDIPVQLNNTLYQTPPYKLALNRATYGDDEPIYSDTIYNYGVIEQADTFLALSLLKNPDFKVSNDNFYFTLLEISTDNTVLVLYDSEYFNHSDSLLLLTGSKLWIPDLSWIPPRPAGQRKFLAIFSHKPLNFTEGRNQTSLYNLVSDILSGTPPVILKDCYMSILTLQISPGILIHQFSPLTEEEQKKWDEYIKMTGMHLELPPICPDPYDSCPLITIYDPKMVNTIIKSDQKFENDYERGGETIPVKSKKYIIKGVTSCKLGIEKVLVNEEEVILIPQDSFNFIWEKEVTLSEGKNTFQVDAFSTGGGENKKDIILDLIIDTTNFSDIGKNYLVIIGVNNYCCGWPPLYTPVNDALEVKNILLSRYKFEPVNTRTLLDANATRESIDQLLLNLRDSMNENDNILIYFAGHGKYDTSMEEGYWIPVDGKIDTPASYLENYRIFSYLKKFKARNSLIIADACFAGSIYLQDFGNSYNPISITKGYQPRSKRVFCSTRMEMVADNDGNGHSPFANALLKILKENKEDSLTIQNLVEKVTTELHNNPKKPPDPLFGSIKFGDDGQGAFVFELKKK